MESGGAGANADWVAGAVLRAVQTHVRSTTDDVDHRIALQAREDLGRGSKVDRRVLIDVL